MQITTLSFGSQRARPSSAFPVSMALLFFLFTFFPVMGEGQTAGYVYAFAGNGNYAFSGDGGAATNAGLWNPGAVAVDKSGNVYIADLENRRIRKVTVSAGIITTYVGNGTYGYSGDGGPATQASITGASRMAFDSSGNLYFTDQANNRVRRVDVSTGIITTIMGNGSQSDSGDGGPAAGATVNNPYGIAVDASGNIYISDASGRIREINVNSQYVTTIAGNGSAGYGGDGGSALAASLSNSDSIAIDPSGNIFLGEAPNAVVRRIDAVSKTITTYVGDFPGTAYQDNVAATQTGLYNLHDVVTDGFGNVYISEDYTIRKITAATHIINTVAGQRGIEGDTGINGPALSATLGVFDLAVNSAGTVYMTYPDLNRVVDIYLFAPPPVQGAPPSGTLTATMRLISKTHCPTGGAYQEIGYYWTFVDGSGGSHPFAGYSADYSGCNGTLYDGTTVLDEWSTDGLYYLQANGPAGQVTAY